MLKTKAMIGLVLGGTLLVMAIAILAMLIPPSYAFRLSAQSLERDEVITIKELHSELEHASRWSPAYLEPVPIEDLVRWIRHPGNQSAQNLSDLYRSGSNEFSQINGMIRILDSVHENDLPRMRKLTVEKLTDNLQAAFRKYSLADQSASFCKIVNHQRYKALIARLKCPPFPQEVNFLRRFFSAAFGYPMDDQYRWIKGFSQSYSKNILPTVLQYESIDRQQVIRIQAGGATVVLTKRRNASVKDTVYKGINSTTNFDVGWTPKGQSTDQPSRVYDTGVRLVCLPWQQKPGTESDQWQPQWPPSQDTISILADRAREFLITFGAPTGLIVSPGSRVEVQDTNGESKTILHFLIASIEDASWRFPLELKLDDQTEEDLRVQIRRATVEMNESFTNHIASRKTLWNHPASLQKNVDGTITGQLKHPNLGTISIQAYCHGDLSTVWKAQLSQDDRKRFVDELIKSQPSLAKHSSRIYLRDITFDSRNGAIECRFATDVETSDSSKNESISMTLSPDDKKKNHVDLPEKLTLLEQPEDLPQSADSKNASERLLRYAEQYLATSYPRLQAPFLTTRLTRMGDEIQIGLTLQIEDWPLLHLGTKSVADETGAKNAIDLMLSDSNVKQQSQVQWKQVGEFEHKRFGKVRGSVTAWNPNKPHATINYQIQVAQVGEIAWNDSLGLVGNQWVGLATDVIVEECQSHATEMLSRIQNAMRTYVPVDLVRVYPDPKGIDGIHWISLEPFRVYLKAVFSPQLFTEYFSSPISVRLDGIVVDRQGLHVPEEFGIDVPMSLPTPYFTFTRPFVLFSFNKPALRLGGHVVPPGPLPQAWVGLFSNESSIKGNWEEQKFEGNSVMTVANTPGVASGRLATDLRAMQLQGDMQGGGRLPGLPTIPARAGGSLSASGSTKSISLDSKAEILGVDVVEISIASGGKPPAILDNRLGPDERTFNIKGRLGLPSGFSMDLEGQSRTDLKKYTVVGTGQFLTLTRKVIATEENVRWENMDMTPSGPFYFDEWSSSLGTLNPLIEKSSDAEKAIPQASDTEKEYAERNFRRPKYGWIGIPFLAKGELESDKYQSVSDLNIKYTDGSIVGWRTSSPTEIEFSIPNTQLPSDFSQNVKGYVQGALYWKRTGSKGSSHLLLTNSESKQPSWHVELNESKSVVRSAPFSMSDSNINSLDPKLRAFCIARYFSISVLNKGDMEIKSSPQQIESRLPGVRFDYIVKENGGDLDATALFFKTDTQIINGTLHPSVLGKPSTSLCSPPQVQSVANQLEYLTGSLKAVHRLVFSDPENSMFGWNCSPSRFANDGKLLLFENAQKERPIGEIPFAAESGLSSQQKLKRSEWMLQAACKVSEIRNVEAWLGLKGILAGRDGTLYVILPNGTSDVKIQQLKRSDFDRWSNADTLEFVPDEWSTPQKREKLSVQQIGSKAMSQEFSLSDRSSNPVSWLGLLQSLIPTGNFDIRP